VSGDPRDQNANPDPSEAEGTLAVNPELEDALREASEAIDEEGHVKQSEEDLASSQEFSGEEIERMAGQLVENRDKYVRLLADFDNFRRRAHKDRQDVIQYGDRAIEHAHQNDGGDLASLLQGVELVQRELYAVLAQHQVQVIEAEGSEFDPSLHEAMAHVQDDSAPPNTVIEVLQRGYQLRDRLLRPARVVVAKPPADADEAETTE